MSWDATLRDETLWATSGDGEYIVLASFGGRLRRLARADGATLATYEVPTSDRLAADGADDGVIGLAVADDGTIAVAVSRVIDNAGNRDVRLRFRKPNAGDWTDIPIEGGGGWDDRWALSPDGHAMGYLWAREDGARRLRIRTLPGCALAADTEVGEWDDTLFDAIAVDAARGLYAVAGEREVLLLGRGELRQSWTRPRGRAALHQLTIDRSGESVAAFAGKRCCLFSAGAVVRERSLPKSLERGAIPLSMDPAPMTARYRRGDALTELRLDDGAVRSSAPQAELSNVGRSVTPCGPDAIVAVSKGVIRLRSLRPVWEDWHLPS